MMKKELILANSTAILHIYLCEQPCKEPYASVLILPGGGYTYCSEREGEPVALAYVAKGLSAFVLTYRTEQPFCFEHTWYDVNEAMRLIHLHSEDWNLDKKKVTVIGFSAGGHLAGALATRGKLRPNAAILCYPVIIDSLAKLISQQLEGIDEHVTEHTPQMFVCATFEDHIVPIRNTLRIINALHEHKIPFECHIYEWGHHGLSLGNKTTEDGNPQNIDDRFATWFELSVSWLRKQFSNSNTLSLGKTWKNNTLGYLLSQPEKRLDIINQYPILENREYLEAVSHYTKDEINTQIALLKSGKI